MDRLKGQTAGANPVQPASSGVVPDNALRPLAEGFVVNGDDTSVDNYIGVITPFETPWQHEHCRLATRSNGALTDLRLGNHSSSRRPPLDLSSACLSHRVRRFM